MAAPQTCILNEAQSDLLRRAMALLASGTPEVVLSTPGFDARVFLQGLLTSLVETGVFTSAVMAVVEGSPAAPRRVQDTDIVLHDQVRVEVRSAQWNQRVFWPKSQDDRVRQAFVNHPVDPAVPFFVTSHAALALWAGDYMQIPVQHRRVALSDVRREARKRHLPADLSKHLLVLSDVHLLSGDEENLRKLVWCWQERGGTVLHTTLLGARDWVDPVISRHALWVRASRWDHQNAVDYRVRVRFHQTKLGADRLSQVRGEAGMGGDLRAACEDLVRLWEEDGRPKSIVELPANEQTGQWCEGLIAAFAALSRPPRVFDAVDPSRSEMFFEQLPVEQDPDTSQVDVFISYRKFEGGHRWRLCANLYQIGFPASPGRFVEIVDRTRILTTFVLPALTPRAWRECLNDPQEVLFRIVSICNDLEACRLPLSDLGGLLEGAPEDTAGALLAWLREDVERTRLVEPDAIFAELAYQNGKSLAVDAYMAPHSVLVVPGLTEQGLSLDAVDGIVRRYVYRHSRLVAEVVDEYLKKEPRPQGLHERALQEAFEKVFLRHREVEPIYPAVVRRLAQMFGRNTAGVEQDLRLRPEPFPVGRVDAALHLYADSHQGFLPKSTFSGPTLLEDLQKVLGEDFTMNDVRNGLATRGFTLVDRAKFLGLPLDSIYCRIGDREIDAALRAFAKDHNGFGPRWFDTDEEEGGATAYFNHPRTWRSVDVILKARGSSIKKKCLQLGLNYGSQD